MQFRLRTLIAACTLVAVFCALFFATPLLVEIPVLSLIVLVAPSVWICGACFAKGDWRPFFLGGICAGWMPHAMLLYYGTMTSAALLSDGDFSFMLGMDEESGIAGRIWIAVAFLLPGIVAFIGGVCGVLVVRYCGLNSRTASAAASKIHEPYVVIESRMTPLSKAE